MNLQDYHAQIDALWDNIETQLEDQEQDVDCERQGSVFTLSLENGQQIVINKQEPLLELWLASRAGGYHLRYENGQWRTAQGDTFWDLLETAFHHFGENITFQRA